MSMKPRKDMNRRNEHTRRRFQTPSSLILCSVCCNVCKKFNIAVSDLFAPFGVKIVAKIRSGKPRPTLSHEFSVGSWATACSLANNKQATIMQEMSPHTHLIVDTRPRKAEGALK